MTMRVVSRNVHWTRSEIKQQNKPRCSIHSTALEDRQTGGRENSTDRRHGASIERGTHRPPRNDFRTIFGLSGGRIKICPPTRSVVSCRVGGDGASTSGTRRRQQLVRASKVALHVHRATCSFSSWHAARQIISPSDRARKSCDDMSIIYAQ